jgi:DNA-binding Lrp family transcriptional regulator
MVTAIILIQAERDSVAGLGEKLVGIEGITEVYTVTGKFDFVAVIRLPEHDALADVVTRDLLQVKGIARTETLVAFKCFSKYDLDRMFSIGLD